MLKALHPFLTGFGKGALKGDPLKEPLTAGSFGIPSSLAAQPPSPWALQLRLKALHLPGGRVLV